MSKFKDFLLFEETLGKGGIYHLEHLEDLALIRGKAGVNDFIESVKELFNEELYSSKKSFLQVKVDGSPALFFGIDPHDKKFFVSTKSIFNKTPKLVKSKEGIEELYPIEDLRKKVETAFDELSKISIEPGVVYHCDILFTEDTKETEKIDEKFYITFQPNTLKYAVLVDSDSSFYNSIKSAKIGIVVHTKYSIKKDKETTFKLRQLPLDFEYIKKQSKTNKNLFVIDNLLPNRKVTNFIKENKENIFKELLELKNKSATLFSKNDIISEIGENYPKLYVLFRKFINSEISKEDYGIFGKNSTTNEKLYDNFKKSIEQYINKEIEKVKQEKTKKQKEEVKNKWFDFLEENKLDFYYILELYKIMISIKNKIVNMLEKGTNIFSRVLSDEGESKDEGFVFVGTKNTLKIIDRIEFSRLNRELSKNRRK